MREVTVGIMVAALLAGCAAPDDREPTAPPVADTAADPDTAAAFGPPPPSLDAAGVEAEVAGLLAYLPNAAQAIQDWRDLFLDAAPPCPNITAPFSIAAPFEGCVATDGRRWAGYDVYTETREPLDVLLEADASVSAPDGATFLAAGKIHLVLDGAGAFATSVTGTWGGDGLEDWTGPGPSVAVWATGDAASAQLYGGVSLAQAALYLSDLAWDADCPGGTGTISVRDPGGWWYTLALDADCGGCGPLDYVGEALGRACVDLDGPLRAMVTATLAAEPPEGGPPPAAEGP